MQFGQGPRVLMRSLCSLSFVRTTVKQRKKCKRESGVTYYVVESRGNWPSVAAKSIENGEFIPNGGVRLPSTIPPYDEALSATSDSPMPVAFRTNWSNSVGSNVPEFEDVGNRLGHL